ncbi:DUF6585 family protein [Streptomyces sp. NPDC000345]|uniref:DUF6585 family protein n=1 Tax=Streptomyces sp. NPDC000345 TaxID=3364537 RepID=UPI0036CEFC06
MSVPGSLSPEVAELASRKNLGRLEHTFLPRKEVDVQEKRSGLLIAAYLAAIACLATGGILLWLFVDRVLALFPLLVAVGMGVLYDGPLFPAKPGGQCLYLFEKGLLMDRGAGQLFAVSWDQAVHYQATVTQTISYMGRHMTSSTFHTSTLVAPSGATVKISNTFAADFRTWMPLIAEAIGRAQAQKAWDAVQEGRKTPYGPFELDATGITATRKGTLPWPMVEAIDVHAGVVVVRQYGRRKAWAQAEVKTVPNLLVFLTVALNLCGR